MSPSHRQLLSTTAATAGLLALPACGSKSSSSSGIGGASAGSSAEAVTYPLTVKHAQRETTVKAASQRVVVLGYDVLDSMAALGPAGVVIGTPETGGNLPKSLPQFQNEKYKDMGGLEEPRQETITEVGPDLVIVANRTTKSYQDFLSKLTTIDMTAKSQGASATAATSPDQGGQGGNGGKGKKHEPSASMTKILTSHSTILGSTFGKKSAAQVKVKEFTDAVAQVTAAAKKAGKGLCLLATDDRVSAFGKGPRFDVIFDEFGVTPAAENIKEAAHGETAPFEFTGQANPDVLLVLDRNATIGQEGSSVKEILDNELATAINAWKNNKIYYLDDPDWYLLGIGFGVSLRMAKEIKGDLSA